ncbi:hypothetical protein R80B4_01981 [Fibrobacteres bacterium R8-0-B4]
MGVKATAKKTPGRKPKAASVPKPRAKKVTGQRGDRVAVLSGRMDKIDMAVLQMTASIAESNARTDALIAESNARTDARIAASRAETDARIAETDASLKETIQRTSEDLRKISADLAESLKNLGGNVGDVNHRLGEIVELVVLPGLMTEMNTLFGHNFDNASPRKRFTDSGQEYAEIDLFLENGGSVMAVEAKTRFTLGMVNKFIKQVESLREHEIKAGVAGKKIYAAIAGLGIDANAKTFALERGIYVVMIDRNGAEFTIESPKGAARTW